MFMVENSGYRKAKIFHQIKLIKTSANIIIPLKYVYMNTKQFYLTYKFYYKPLF